MNEQIDNTFDEKTLADIDRHHLQTAARDAYKDVAVADACAAAHAIRRFPQIISPQRRPTAMGGREGARGRG